MGKVKKITAERDSRKSSSGRKGKLTKPLSQAQDHALDYMGVTPEKKKEIKTYEQLDFVFDSASKNMTKYRQLHGATKTPATGRTKSVLRMANVEIDSDTEKEEAYLLASRTFPNGVLVYQLSELVHTYNCAMDDVRDLTKDEAAELISHLRQEDKEQEEQAQE